MSLQSCVFCRRHIIPPPDPRRAAANLRSATEVERRFNRNILPVIGHVRLVDLHRRDVNRVPAAAVGSVPSLASPDAELIALGNELEALLRRYIPTLLGGFHPSWDAHFRAIERAGIVEGISGTDDQWRLYDIECRLAEDEMGVVENERLLNPLYREADRLGDAINALPATTEAGLRAKVLNVCLTNVSMLLHDRDAVLELGPTEVRELVIATCSVLGIALPDGFPAGGSVADAGALS